MTTLRYTVERAIALEDIPVVASFPKQAEIRDNGVIRVYNLFSRRPSHNGIAVPLHLVADMANAVLASRRIFVIDALGRQVPLDGILKSNLRYDGDGGNLLGSWTGPYFVEDKETE